MSSGALLLFDGVSESSFVPKIEVPLLVGTHRADPDGFQLHIVSASWKPDSPGECDFDAPGKQLKAKYPETKQLRDRLQWRLPHSGGEGGKLTSELNPVFRDLLRNRLKVRRPQLDDGETEIGLQARPRPNHLLTDGSAVPRADLHIRFRQDSAMQTPEELDYRCLQQALSALIDELHAARIRHVFFRGGYYSSLAWALGVMLPHACEIEHFTWRDTYGKD